MINLALFVSLVGLVVLYFVLPDISESDSLVHMTGKVVSVDVRDKLTMVQLVLDKPMSVLSFDAVDVNEGDAVFVSGELQEYHGRVEIVARQIRKK